MTEFVPLGEQIEMEEVLAEPTADRVRIVHCIDQVDTSKFAFVGYSIIKRSPTI